jgi:hypothetical protein
MGAFFIAVIPVNEEVAWQEVNIDAYCGRRNVDFGGI